MKIEIIEKGKSIICLKANKIHNINLNNISRVANTLNGVCIISNTDVLNFYEVENVEEVVECITNKLEQWNIEKYNVWK